MSLITAKQLATPAFNYDQSTVPSSPTNGKTWRERDNNNNIIGEWFWNGTLWVSCQTYTIGEPLFIFSTTAIRQFNVSDGTFKTLITKTVVNYSTASIGLDSTTNYWEVFLIQTALNASPLNTIATLGNITTINTINGLIIDSNQYLVNTDGTFSPKRTCLGFRLIRNGTATSFSCSYSIFYKIVRV